MLLLGFESHSSNKLQDPSTENLGIFLQQKKRFSQEGDNCFSCVQRARAGSSSGKEKQNGGRVLEKVNCQEKKLIIFWELTLRVSDTSIVPGRGCNPSLLVPRSWLEYHRILCDKQRIIAVRTNDEKDARGPAAGIPAPSFDPAEEIASIAPDLSNCQGGWSCFTGLVSKRGADKKNGTKVNLK